MVEPLKPISDISNGLQNGQADVIKLKKVPKKPTLVPFTFILSLNKAICKVNKILVSIVINIKANMLFLLIIVKYTELSNLIIPVKILYRNPIIGTETNKIKILLFKIFNIALYDSFLI